MMRSLYFRIVLYSHLLFQAFPMLNNVFSPISTSVARPFVRNVPELEILKSNYLI